MRVLLILLVAALGAAAGCARASIMPAPPWGAKAPLSITPPLTSLPVGEELHYEVFWWGVPVGTAALRASNSSEKDQQDLLQLDFQARSNWYLQAFYPVRVRLTSLVDPRTGAPHRFESYVKRHWRVHESVITFDRSTATALHELPEDRRVNVGIQPSTQDGLSMLYYVRTIPLELGKTVPLEISADGKNWALKAQVVRAHMVRVGRLGERPAVEGRVELAYPVPFFHGARARVWLSADEDRIPLLAKIRSRIGPVTVVLVRRSALTAR